MTYMDVVVVQYYYYIMCASVCPIIDDNTNGNFPGYSLTGEYVLLL